MIVKSAVDGTGGDTESAGDVEESGFVTHGSGKGVNVYEGTIRRQEGRKVNAVGVQREDSDLFCVGKS